MDIDYTVKYSDRKTLSIIVERDRSIIVRAPKGVKKNKIENAINSKKLWIYQKLNHLQKYSDKTILREYVSGESFLYLGKSYILDVVEKNIDGLLFTNKFEISKTNQPDASQLFERWYRKQAKEIIHTKVNEYAKSLGVEIGRIFIIN